MIPSVLIIEDESILSHAMRDYLTRPGYEAVVAGSGEEGLKLLRDSEMDLVVLDYQLPGIDGIHAADRIIGDSAATRQLRAQAERLAGLAAGGGAPAILITGETGTGKGLIARVIHDLGPRTERPFIESYLTHFDLTILSLSRNGRGASTEIYCRSSSWNKSAAESSAARHSVGETMKARRPRASSKRAAFQDLTPSHVLRSGGKWVVGRAAAST